MRSGEVGIAFTISNPISQLSIKVPLSRGHWSTPSGEMSVESTHRVGSDSEIKTFQSILGEEDVGESRESSGRFTWLPK